MSVKHVNLVTRETISIIAIPFVFSGHQRWLMFTQEPRLSLITSRNHSVDTTLSPTEHRHDNTDLSSVHKAIVPDIDDLRNNTESNLSVYYDQRQRTNSQTKQETNKNIDQNPTMETSIIIPNFTPPCYHSPTSSHTLCEKLITGGTHILSHKQQPLPQTIQARIPDTPLCPFFQRYKQLFNQPKMMLTPWTITVLRILP